MALNLIPKDYPSRSRRRLDRKKSFTFLRVTTPPAYKHPLTPQHNAVSSQYTNFSPILECLTLNRLVASS